MPSKSNDKKNIFQFSYNVARKNISNPKQYEKEIYNGFGLQHKSNTSGIYVSVLNRTSTSAVSQPIGEAITLLARIIQSIEKSGPIAKFMSDRSSEKTYLEISLPQDYRDNGVVESDLYTYKVYRDKEDIYVGAYDSHGWLLTEPNDSVIHYHPHHKLMAIFTLLLIEHKQIVPEFSQSLERFAANPCIEDFVRIHEDFYHMNKDNSYAVSYEDILTFNQSINKLKDKEIYNKVFKNSKSSAPKPVVIPKFDAKLFNDRQLAAIPVLPKELVLPANLKPFCVAVHDGAAVATLFHGPSGTGKSMLCKLICQAIGLPIMQTVNCSESLDEFIFGKYIPKDDKIIFHENPITEAVRSGGAVIFEEINFAKPQHLAFLHSLLDDNGMILLDDGTEVKRHPNFRFFATMNDGYFGTKELNQATLNRFNYTREIPELSDEAIRNMLKVRVPQYEKYVDQIITVYKGIKAKAEEEEIDITISPRNLENWVKIAQYEGFIAAAESTIIPVAKMDRKLESAIRGLINVHKWAA